ncbi:hypothetical protein [Sphingomonas sp. MMS24-J13]|uniref:hypothetical protein n=1 Tax=Sphingomonas sp. MMS24-J13 TaxID=3238686 RepID=UPI00384BB06C
MIPLRYIFRSRWAALIWAIGICWTAVSFAGGDASKLTVNAANSADNDAAKVGAALAEDD